jgi:quercetin dioxygenase-like cupin family protein
MTADQRLRPIIATPGSPPIAAAGASLVVREWTLPGPSYLHVHNQDDEAWHVLEGSLRFIFADGEIDAPAGTTVFVPAGLPHTYLAPEGARYLIILTPKIDRLIGRLLDPDHPDNVRATLGAFDTEVFELPAGKTRTTASGH